MSFYRFPVNSERRAKWISAINRKNWKPSEYSWLCSDHFAGGRKCDDVLSPAYITTIFSFISSTAKRKLSVDLIRYGRSTIRRKACAMISDLDDDSSELHVDAEVQTKIESLEKGTNMEVQTGIKKATNTISQISHGLHWEKKCQAVVCIQILRRN